VAQELMKKGFTKILILKGGWNEWLRSGYPTEKK
jgi:rhodanese-related sulfurtransferase